MNVKAEKFAKMLADTGINCFSEEQTKDELNTVLFRSSMEIEGQRLPLVVIIDDSIYVICRTLVAGKCLTDGNRFETLKFLNGLNSNYKTFKYFTTEAGELLMDICLPTTNETFEPNIIRALIDLSVKNLEENYRPIMQIVWGNPVNKIAEA
ncbi:MAG: hypothetical protein GQF41_3059 [Candidatus Rifleibacterium amylolyticum]|nr:MAG: hypothetical protein GQF41_3059 [Candidatus Rifleibacterium amylolyticum]